MSEEQMSEFLALKLSLQLLTAVLWGCLREYSPNLLKDDGCDRTLVLYIHCNNYLFIVEHGLCVIMHKSVSKIRQPL